MKYGFKHTNNLAVQMIAARTIRKQIQMGKQQKIIAAVHLFFKHKDSKYSKETDNTKLDTTSLCGINYYLEQENWVFRERARQNSIAFFDHLSVVFSTHSTREQKIECVVLTYVKLLFEKPDFAAYLITDLMSSPNEKLSHHLRNRYPFNQLFACKTGDLKICSSFSVIISLIGMILLPLAMIYYPENNEVSQFNELENLIEQRKKLLPLWIKTAMEKL